MHQKASLLPKHFSPQTRSRLAQERSVKLDAFQRLEELQSQLNDAERWSVQMSSPGGKQVPCSELRIVGTGHSNPVAIELLVIELPDVC